MKFNSLVSALSIAALAAAPAAFAQSQGTVPTTGPAATGAAVGGGLTPFTVGAVIGLVTVVAVAGSSNSGNSNGTTGTTGTTGTVR